jgi:hypothetical protein
MSRCVDSRVVLTLAFLFGLLALAVLRTNGRRLPSWSEWGAVQSNRASSNPEGTIYSMFDAARAGNTRAYLEAFSGPMREQLLQVVKESSESKFASYLSAQNSDLQGVAVAIVDRPSSEEAQARVECAYSDHSEAQSVYLRREGSRWKILKVAAAEQLKTLVPFGGVTD